MKRFVRHFLYLALLFSWGNLESQAQVLMDDVRSWAITSANDTIQFIKIDADTTQRKPVLLFCQGSLPYPLIITTPDKAIILPVSSVDYSAIARHFHIIMIAMPHTPVVAPKETLSRDMYVPDISRPDKLDERYMEDNHRETYLTRGNAVLNYLRRQAWVDRDKIILLGHSQGASVAAGLASENPDIHALGYFSGGVLGRYAQLIMEKRNASTTGQLSKQEAQAHIEGLHAYWQDICRGTNVDTIGDRNHTWRSFSVPMVEKLTTLKMPVFVAYGTEDIGARPCELLPIYFELAGKTNYKLRAFVGCGHNFEEILPDGKHDFKNMHWDEAVNEFIRWCMGDDFFK